MTVYENFLICSLSPIFLIYFLKTYLQPLSDGRMLRLQDVKETIKAKCVAENDGGRTETSFEIFVTGLF